jgi:hypothetical protein
VRRPRPSRSSRPGLAGGILLVLGLSACATAPPAPTPAPIAEDARTALARIEQHRRTLVDLRSLTEITVRRGLWGEADAERQRPGLQVSAEQIVAISTHPIPVDLEPRFF